MGFKGKQYIWKDRRRRMGMPLSFTRYALSEDRLFLSVGFFSIRDDELLLYRVRDITTRRSLWQRLFDVGTVTVISSDKSQPTLELKNVKNPLMVKELLHERVEEMKLKRRVRVGEIMGSDDADENDFDEDENT
jgi:uncharacterized membrane protein YdbT with pleckstrin-like domain